MFLSYGCPGCCIIPGGICCCCMSGWFVLAREALDFLFALQTKKAMMPAMAASAATPPIAIPAIAPPERLLLPVELLLPAPLESDPEPLEPLEPPEPPEPVFVDAEPLALVVVESPAVEGLLPPLVLEHNPEYWPCKLRISGHSDNAFLFALSHEDAADS